MLALIKNLEERVIAAIRIIEDDGKKLSKQAITIKAQRERIAELEREVDDLEDMKAM